jgi:uncharacterized protein with GYD domain
MSKYLITGSYTPEGVKGLIKHGGSSRKEVVEKMVNNLNGKLEGFYYALGETDIFVIVDVPNVASIAAISLAVNSTGLVMIKVTSLLTAEEIDGASKITVSYTPPKA